MYRRVGEFNTEKAKGMENQEMEVKETVCGNYLLLLCDVRDDDDDNDGGDDDDDVVLRGRERERGGSD